jgi:hypothetical protein
MDNWQGFQAGFASRLFRHRKVEFYMVREKESTAASCFVLSVPKCQLIEMTGIV